MEQHDEVDLERELKATFTRSSIQDYFESGAGNPRSEKARSLEIRLWEFDDFLNIGYGELREVSLRMEKISNTQGVTVLRYRQEMRCYHSSKVIGNDMQFFISPLDGKGDLIFPRFFIGGDQRACGIHERTLAATWYLPSPDALTRIVDPQLQIAHYSRVRGC